MLKRISVVIFVLAFLFSVVVIAGAYNEAPELKEKVASGDLPPIEERLPKEPFIVEPIDEIGSYGGTLRVASTIPESWGDDIMLMAYRASLITASPEDQSVIPGHLAREVEMSEDAKTFTIHLRRGLKWSDGHPYTADDIMFWYNDVLNNEELTTSISSLYTTKGELMQFEKVDDYTVKIKFTAPNPYFMNRLFFEELQLYPKHYLKQFHPEYESEEKIIEMAQTEGFDNWYELFQQKGRGVGVAKWNPECPTVGPYVLNSMSSSRRTWVRNPYYWKVDTAGNQLPYLDGINCDIVSNAEVVKGQVISGQLDFVAWFSGLNDYPMYKNYEDDAGYRTFLYETIEGSHVTYMVNMTHEDPVLREIFQDLRFRKALSLGINREEINEAIYYGQGRPRQQTVVNKSQYFEPEFATKYTEFDPERANELLDEMGLGKDSQGNRLRPDGEKLQFEMTSSTHLEGRLSDVELVVQHWNENLGIDVNVKLISGELLQQRAPSNKLDAEFWAGGGIGDLRFPTDPKSWLPSKPPFWGSTKFPEWLRWYATDGEQGEEPIEEVKQMRNWWEEALVEPDLERRIELFKNILRSNAENLWVIGSVGGLPRPIIVKNELRNIAEEGIYGYDLGNFNVYHPSQIFIKE